MYLVSQGFKVCFVVIALLGLAACSSGGGGSDDSTGATGNVSTNLEGGFEKTVDNVDIDNDGNPDIDSIFLRVIFDDTTNDNIINQGTGSARAFITFSNVVYDYFYSPITWTVTGGVLTITVTNSDPLTCFNLLNQWQTFADAAGVYNINYSADASGLTADSDLFDDLFFDQNINGNFVRDDDTNNTLGPDDTAFSNPASIPSLNATCLSPVGI